MTQPTRSALLAASAILMLIFLSDLPANAQGGGATPLTCQTSVAVTPTVRSEGYTEQTGDITLTCTGGTPTPAGQPIPQFNIKLLLNTQATSKILVPLTGASEALFIAGDPGAASNPSTPQLPCNSIDGCIIMGNGTGNGAYNGTSGHPNIFQAVVSGNSDVWNGVPIDPPGPNGKSVFRFTDVRANAAGLGPGSTAKPVPITGNITFTSVTSGFSPPIINNPLVTVANSQPGTIFSVPNPKTVGNCTALNNVQLLTPPLQEDVQTNFRFGEGFSSSWKLQESSSVPFQPVPGQVYNTEGGFSSPAFKGTPLEGAGQPAHGTRLKAVFNNIPNGVRIFVSTVNVTSTGAPATIASAPFLQLVNGNSPAVTPIPPLGTSGTAELTVVNGSAIGTYEILYTDPFSLEYADVPVFFAFNPPPNLNANVLGITTIVTGGFSGPDTLLPVRDSSIFSNLSDPSGPDGASTLFGIQSGNPGPTGFPFFVNNRPGSSGLITFAQCTGPAQNLTVASPFSNAPVDRLFLAFPSIPPGANVFLPPASFPFTVSNATVQTSTAIGGGGGGFFNPIAPGGFGTEGYKKQDFSYQVTPTATTDQKWLSVTSNGSSSPTTFTAIVDPSGLAPGNYSGNISISALGQNSLTSTLTTTIPVSLTIAPPGPLALAADIKSATTYQASFAVPGMPLVVYGSALGPSTLTLLSLTPDNSSIATSVAGTRVLFDGTPAPMIYSSNGQISMIVPFELVGKTSTQVVVEYNGVQSPPVSLPVLSAAPGLFAANSQGYGQGAILNADGSYNSTENPAPVGSTIVLYASGAGQTNPPGKTGHLSSAPYPAPVLPVSVFIDGVQAQVQYAGDAPGLFEGVLQVNAVIPAGVKPGNRVVVVKVGSTQTPPWATVAVSAAQ